MLIFLIYHLSVEVNISVLLHQNIQAAVYVITYISLY